MSEPEETPVVAAIAPLEAGRKREIRAAAERAREQFFPLRLLPALAVLPLPLMLLSLLPDLWAIVWSPPPASTWRTMEGVIDEFTDDGDQYFLIRGSGGGTLLTCAPLLKSAEVCSVRYKNALMSRIGRPSRVRLSEHQNWRGVDYVLTRIEDPDGRYVDYPQYRLRFSDVNLLSLLLSLLPFLLFGPLFFLPGALTRAHADRRERSL